MPGSDPIVWQEKSRANEPGSYSVSLGGNNTWELDMSFERKAPEYSESFSLIWADLTKIYAELLRI